VDLAAKLHDQFDIQASAMERPRKRTPQQKCYRIVENDQSRLGPTYQGNSQLDKANALPAYLVCSPDPPHVASRVFLIWTGTVSISGECLLFVLITCSFSSGHPAHVDSSQRVSNGTFTKDDDGLGMPSEVLFI
jgi:hypothetical protein